MIYAEKVALERIAKELGEVHADALRSVRILRKQNEILAGPISEAENFKSTEVQIITMKCLLEEVERLSHPLMQLAGIAAAGFPTTQEIQELRKP